MGHIYVFYNILTLLWNYLFFFQFLVFVLMITSGLHLWYKSLFFSILLKPDVRFWERYAVEDRSFTLNTWNVPQNIVFGSKIGCIVVWKSSLTGSIVCNCPLPSIMNLVCFDLITCSYSNQDTVLHPKKKPTLMIVTSILKIKLHLQCYTVMNNELDNKWIAR